MLAVVCRQFGSPDLLRLEDSVAPQPGANEVLMSVRAVSLSLANVLVVADQHPHKRALPFLPGTEAGGIIKAVGPGVTGFKAGDAVIGLGVNGSCAEEIICSTARLRRMPVGVDFSLAVAGGGSYATALHGLRDRAFVKAGETVLVLGAAGGVGLAAVELGKLLGARVIACASTQAKLDLCKQYGADELINYESEDLRAAIKRVTGDKGVNVVIDPVGGRFADAAVRGMAWGGRYIVIGFGGGSVPDVSLNLPLLKGCSIMGMSITQLQQHDPKASKALLEDVTQLLESGRIKPHIWATYPLAKTPQALNDLLHRKVLGKAIVLAGER